MCLAPSLSREQLYVRFDAIELQNRCYGFCPSACSLERLALNWAYGNYTTVSVCVANTCM
jgi:hypothetical protein